MAPLFTGNRFGFGRGAAEAPQIPFSATGGTITEAPDGYTYHSFKVPVASPYPTTADYPGNFVVEGTPGSFTVDCLLIGGGGGGGKGPSSQTGGGGGGAGAVIYKEGRPLADGEYAIQVGRGGNAQTEFAPGNFSTWTGGDTTFNGLTAKGGGAGGQGQGVGQVGVAGGSSGGGGAGTPDDAPNPSNVTPSSTQTGTAGHPGAVNATSPDNGWGNIGGVGGRNPTNLSGGGGGGGCLQAGVWGDGPDVVNPTTPWPGGHGGGGAVYSVINAANDGVILARVAGGGGSSCYGPTNTKAGTGDRGSGGSAMGGTWPSLTGLIMTANPKQEGKDGAGGGGAGGGERNVDGGTNNQTNGARGGVGYLHIRYETAAGVPAPSGISVTGGTLVSPNPGGFEIRHFPTSGNFVVSSGTVTDAQVYVCAGGGAGGFGGGGAGGGVYAEFVTLSPTGGPGSNGTYKVEIGSGGSPPRGGSGTNGEDSYFGNNTNSGDYLRARGGGGTEDPAPGDANTYTGSPGGCGGGSGWGNRGWGQSTQVDEPQPFSPNCGRLVVLGNTAGMGGMLQYGYAGGGGGGQGGQGTNALSDHIVGGKPGGGMGGAGWSAPWIPTSLGQDGFFGGGGGGAYGYKYPGNPPTYGPTDSGKGGKGGGGYGAGYGPDPVAGPTNPATGTDGQDCLVANSGGGSGGSNGGSNSGCAGIVIVRYRAS